MKSFILALFVLALTALPAFAFDTPQDLLTALYAPYAKGDSFDWSKWDESKFRSSHLNELFAKDLKEANGDVGRLDFDPYIDGQDYQITDLKFGEATITGTTAKVEVTFKNFDAAEDLMFTLVVVSSNKDFPYSLKAIMEGPLS